jgi:hypothetical protein
MAAANYVTPPIKGAVHLLEFLLHGSTVHNPTSNPLGAMHRCDLFSRQYQR